MLEVTHSMQYGVGIDMIHGDAQHLSNGIDDWPKAARNEVDCCLSAAQSVYKLSYTCMTQPHHHPSVLPRTSGMTGAAEIVYKDVACKHASSK